MIETNLTKKGLEQLSEDPYMKLAKIFFGEKEWKKLLDEAMKTVEKKEKKEPETPARDCPHRVTIKNIIPSSVINSVKVDKDKFFKFVDGFAATNDTVAELEENGFMFTEDSPIVRYENLIAGLLESIFGKEVQEDICAYAYGDSNIQLEDLWNKITKKNNF